MLTLKFIVLSVYNISQKKRSVPELVELKMWTREKEVYDNVKIYWRRGTNQRNMEVAVQCQMLYESKTAF